MLDAALLSAISSPRRREILRLVWRDEQAAGDIHAAMPDVTFGAVSMHLRALTEAGLLTRRQDKQRRLYRANRAALGPVGAMLERTWADALWKLKILAEFEDTRRGPRPASRRPHSRKVRHS